MDSVLCSIDTCGENTRGTPFPATRVVARQTVDGDGDIRIELVTVCDGHADGWYDGCDDFLPQINLTLGEAALCFTKLHGILDRYDTAGHYRVSLCQIELDKAGVPTPWHHAVAV